MATETAMPSCSIIIPTYQRRELVCSAVRAAAQLDFPGQLELIVVIDGSTDGTEPALRDIALPFSFRIFSQPNAGLAAARNRGAAEASGDVLLFLDDDMICQSDLAQQHCRSIQEGADAVVGEIPLHPASPPGFLTEGIARWADTSAIEARGREVLSPFNIYGGQLSVRRSVFQALGGFDSAFTDGGKYGKEDADFGVRLLAHHRVVHNPHAISLHRYVVSPRDYLLRGFALGQADARFLRRHPDLAHELLSRNNARRRTTKVLLRPLARVPGAARLIAEVSAVLAGLVLKTPLRSSRLFGRIFHVVRQFAYWAGLHQNGGASTAPPVLILCYHAIADLSTDPVLADYGVPRAQFERQITSLRRRGFNFISARTLAAGLDNRATLPERPVLLTFDDCYADLPDTVSDVLHPAQIPALAFAVTGMTSGTNEWDQAIGAGTMPLLGWDALRGLSDAGVTVGSHSRTHRPMPRLSDKELAAETAGAAADFEARGCGRPEFFAFPYGEQDARCSDAVRDAGYSLAFGLADKHATGEMDRFNLPRVEVLAADGPLRFWLKSSWPRLAIIFRWRQYLRLARASIRRIPDQPIAAQSRPAGCAKD